MDALSSLSQFMSGPGGQSLVKAGEIGATGAGLFGNIAAERSRSQELNYLKQQQANLADPTKIASEVAGATQPLNRALVQSVGNQVSGTLAEQGLAQAPGIQATALSQALAPFEQQNQQTALQIVMQRLGLPVSYAQTLLAGNPSQVNLAPLLALLQKGSGGSGGGTDIASLMKLLQAQQPATPAQTDWSANLPGVTQPTPLDTSSWQIPDWLSSPAPAPAS